MGLCNGSIAIMMVLMLLVVVAPKSVLGAGRTRRMHSVHGVEPGVVVSQSSLSESSSSPSPSSTVRIGCRNSSVRKLLEQRRRPAMEDRHAANRSGTISPPPPRKVDDQASTSIPSGTTQSTPPAHFSNSRFAFLFRSLAKGSPTPTPGTPSPGHN